MCFASVQGHLLLTNLDVVTDVTFSHALTLSCFFTDQRSAKEIYRFVSF